MITLRGSISVAKASASGILGEAVNFHGSQCAGWELVIALSQKDRIQKEDIKYNMNKASFNTFNLINLLWGSF